MPVNRATDASGMKQSYGYQKIETDEKQARVNEVFHTVAKRYDVMNDLMSAGMHRLWKDAMVSCLSPSRTRPFNILDVAGGTGDIAFRAVKASRGNACVSVLDINGSMLEVGKQRAIENGLAEKITFVEANAEELPFEDNHFDAYTIAFGIRNVPQIDKALAEAYRVLKYTGHLLVLEFSEVQVPILDSFYDKWSMQAIPEIGKLVTGEREPYRYLVESIRKFPNQGDFAAMIEQAGFSRVTYTNYTGGVVALHSGWKL